MADFDKQYDKGENESLDEYRMRIGRACLAHKLTWTQAASYMNKVLGTDYGECAFRKYFTGWYQGYLYAMRQSEDAATRILAISDLHVPFNIDVENFAEYVERVDVLHINGDVIDCYALSKYPKSYRINPVDEMVQAREYLIKLIQYIKPAKVVINIGNHEIRLQNYLNRNVDVGLQELMPKTPMEYILIDGFNRYDKRAHSKTWYAPLCEVFPSLIEYHDTWYSQIGQTLFCHPLTYSSMMMQTAEKARRYFKDNGYNFTSLVMAHTHQIGQYTVGDTTIYEQGACCDLSGLKYNDGKLSRSQQAGFMFICQDKDGKLIENKTKLVRL